MKVDIKISKPHKALNWLVLASGRLCCDAEVVEFAVRKTKKLVVTKAETFNVEEFNFSFFNRVDKPGIQSLGYVIFRLWILGDVLASACLEP